MSYKYSKWLLSLSFGKTLLFFTIIDEILSNLFPVLTWLLDAGDVFGGSYIESLSRDIISSIIFAPLIETAIAQGLIFFIIRLFTKNLYILYLISSLIFAVGHTYSVWYMVATFFSGFIFIGLFATLSKKSMKQAYWGVVIVHAFSNCIAVAYSHW